ncbi:unnamed protein product [Dicrocoelium dendriticum]|nr:unnamed protein product [Dicrocoelium dendriticum]
MKAQPNTPLLPPGSLMIQSGQGISQQVGPAPGIPPGQAASVPHQNLQVWTPGPGGAISVSGIGAPRCHPNIVTFPSGQAILMASLVTTASNQVVPLPVSSPLPKPPMQTSQVGSPIILSTPTPPPLSTPLPTHHLASSNVAMIRGVSGPISVALPTGMLPNSPASVAPVAVPNSYASTVPLPTQSDPTTQFLEQSPMGHSSFNNNNLQSLLPGTPVICDQSTMGMLSVSPHSDTNTIQPPAPLVSNYVPSQQQQPRSFLSELTSDVPGSNGGSGITVFSSDGTQPITNFGEFSHPKADGIHSANATVTVQQNTDNHMSGDPTPTTLFRSQSEVASETHPTTTATFPVDDKPGTHSTGEDTVTCGLSVFTPLSLAHMLKDLDPQLQLDPEAKEVLVNLANEFVTSVASKAQKLANHRSSSVVEAKDVHFCLDHEWDIHIPGYMPEDCSSKQSAMSEAHKQRLALIKKHIKKM